MTTSDLPVSGDLPDLHRRQRNGIALIEPTFEYLLRKDPAGPRIHVVISVDEPQQIAALLARQA